MTDLFTTGIIPTVNAYLEEKSKEERDYGDYWSASSAGYCMRKVIFDRLKVPLVKEDARKTRVFEVGHVFHKWLQDITKEAGISMAQEVELQDENLMIRGHFDDLVLVKVLDDAMLNAVSDQIDGKDTPIPEGHLILYDYKTAHSKSFHYSKGRPMSHYHKMQLGTYMYMLRKGIGSIKKGEFSNKDEVKLTDLIEARTLKISKDDLCMQEHQLLWTPELEKEVYQYWSTLNGYWDKKMVPKCTCADYEGGFMAKEAYNPYFYEDEPCSLKWLAKCKQEGKVTW